MPVKILIDKLKLRHTVNAAWKAGLPILTKEILDDMNEYCKFDSGDLIQSSYRHTKYKRGKIVWQKPYARRQYWKIQTAYTKDGHDLATWKWAEVAKAHNMEKWQRQADVLFKMMLNQRGYTVQDEIGGDIG